MLVDPDRAFYRQFAKEGDSNWGKYDNAKVTDLLTQARQLGDQTKRADLYAQAAQIIVDEAPYIYVTYQGYVCVYNTKVKGYVVNPSQSVKDIREDLASAVALRSRSAFPGAARKVRRVLAVSSSSSTSSGM